MLWLIQAACRPSVCLSRELRYIRPYLDFKTANTIAKFDLCWLTSYWNSFFFFCYPLSTWVTSKPDFKVMVLLLVFMQLTRDLFAIAKFLFDTGNMIL